MIRRLLSLLCVAGTGLVQSALAQGPLTTAFTYQGSFISHTDVLRTDVSGAHSVEKNDFTYNPAGQLTGSHQEAAEGVSNPEEAAERDQTPDAQTS